MNPLLISLNVKDTDPVHLDKALSEYLKRNYGSTQWKSFYDKAASAKFDKLRTTSNSELAVDTLIELNYKYAAILEQLSLRSSNNSHALDVDFTWYETSYNDELPKKKYSQKSIAIEKSSIIFNIAVLLSKSAKEKISGGTQDYKSAISNLSKSYGCFQYLTENFLNSPSLDLKTNTTTFLSNLVHAEAQELFALKLINSADLLKQASLLSKLCLSTHKLYASCEEFYTLDFSIMYGELKWRDIIHFKQLFYKALCLFYNAVALENASKIGEAIAFLELSKTTLYESLPLKLSVKEMEIEPFQGIIEKQLTNLVKDNDFIYHDIIPKEVSIESIKAMDAIKPVHYSKQQLLSHMEDVASECSLLFKGIVPMEVYEKESIYSEKKSAKLREETDLTQTADWEYESFIEFTNLAKLLPDLEARYKGSRKDQTDPEAEYINEQVSRWSADVSSSPYSDIAQQQKSLFKTRQDIFELLNNVTDKEASVKLKASLVQATQSDEKLFNLVAPYISEIQLLKNTSVLKNTFDSFKSGSGEVDLLDIDDSKNEQILENIKDCKETYDHLKLLKRERTRIFDEFKKKINDDESDEGVMQLILANLGAKNLDSLFDELLEKQFGELSSRIESTIFRQKNMITEIKIQLDKIFKTSGVETPSAEAQEKTNKRDQLFSKVEKAYNCFKMFENDLPKGIQFYNSLLTMITNIQPKPSTPTPTPHLNQHFNELNIGSTNSTGASSQYLSSMPPQLPPGPSQSGSFRDFNPVPNLPRRPSEMGQGTSVNGGFDYSRPHLPPKPSSRASSVNQEMEYQQNPTSFYNNPSVFDESLYNSYK